MKKITVIMLAILLCGCASKFVPYHESPEGKASVAAKRAYDTGLAEIKQEHRERKITTSQSHRKWIELLKPTPQYWALREVMLDAQYDLLRKSELVERGNLPSSVYNDAARQHNEKINSLENAVDRNNAQNTQMMMNAMNQDYDRRMRLLEIQNNAYQPAAQPAPRNTGPVHCTTSRLDPNYSTTTCR